jgi:hypothetical protein
MHRLLDGGPLREVPVDSFAGDYTSKQLRRSVIATPNFALADFFMSTTVRPIDGQGKVDPEFPVISSIKAGTSALSRHWQPLRHRQR